MPQAWIKVELSSDRFVPVVGAIKPATARRALTLARPSTLNYPRRR